MKNGKIELARFAMCMAVLLYHLNLEYFDGGFYFGDSFTFFSHGRSGVEFFYIISGFLMAKSVSKRRNDGVPVGKASVQFLWRKFKRLFPPHIIAVIITSVYIIFKYTNVYEALLARFSSIFFLQKTGVSTLAFVGVEWYVSSMLIAMAIIYPLLKANYDVTARAVAPIGSLLIMGYLIQHYEALPNSSLMDGFTFNGNLRAVGVMLLGVCTYEASQLIRKHNLMKRLKPEMLLVELIGYLGFGYYIISSLDSFYDAIAALFCAAAVAVTFARDDLRFYNNKLFYFLGEISFPIYLVQNIVRKFVKEDIADMRAYKKILICMALCIAVGIIAYYLGKLFEKLSKAYFKKRLENK